MQSIIDYFSTMPSLHRTLLLVGGIMFFWLLEGLQPLFRFKKHDKIRHAITNVFFTISTAAVNLSLAFVMISVSEWTVNNGFGYMQWLNFIPMPILLFTGLVLLDLISAYSIHYLNHKVKWFWLFHLIHHSDTKVDTTTANRHHPGESILRLIATTIGIFLLGVPVWMIYVYQSLSVILSQFNHANIILPDRLNKVLSWIIVTPNMHHVHHHYQQPLTDTNFGNIFSIWDHLFGTYAEVDNSTLVYGIDTHMEEDENSRIGNLLKIPFQEYRDISKLGCNDLTEKEELLNGS